ncbi:MAG: ATP-binding protein [Sporomusaceae bacterium]|nr:ATP-binding protein [Sporomusaceae bacterium]
MYSAENGDYRTFYLMKEDDPKEYFKSAKIGLVYVDSCGKVRSLNREAEKMCGVNRAQVIGQTADQSFSHFGRQFVRLFTLAEYEDFQTYNSRIVQDEKTCYFHADAIRLRDGQGNSSGIVVVLQDVSEIRTTLRQIQTTQLLMSMGELAAGVAHHVRTPLTTISGYLQIMLNRLDNDQYTVRRDIVEMMLDEVSYINHVVKELVMFAKPPLQKQPGVNINRVLDESLLLVFKQMGGERIGIVKSLADGLPKINADSNLLQQAFVNILQNAMEAMPDVGEVSIRSWLHADLNMLVIAIADVGCGVDPGILSRIFEPFYTTKLDRVGLGLPIAHRIVSEHGGFIHISSNERIGTKVHVYLPIVEDQLRQISAVHQQILNLQ